MVGMADLEDGTATLSRTNVAGRHSCRRPCLHPNVHLHQRLGQQRRAGHPPGVSDPPAITRSAPRATTLLENHLAAGSNPGRCNPNEEKHARPRSPNCCRLGVEHLAKCRTPPSRHKHLAAYASGAPSRLGHTHAAYFRMVVWAQLSTLWRLARTQCFSEFGGSSALCTHTIGSLERTVLFPGSILG
ncbi:MAG: hypothetical protein BWY25_00568 [Chloroflexi bacterium ADurb.Bin222]|nr:MAG: hypothetical protein BWY25_00568 [Chloroflexi bacterium ADurb.Bin222]